MVSQECSYSGCRSNNRAQWPCRTIGREDKQTNPAKGNDSGQKVDLAESLRLNYGLKEACGVDGILKALMSF